MKRILSILFILILSAGYFSGCKKDKGDPPVLPPMESMTIDFSNFTAQKKSAVEKGTENSSWEFAASVVTGWSSIVAVTLVVPITAFKLAIEEIPEYLSTRTWQWSYNVIAAGSTYKARLTGEIRASDVAWKMYITKEGTGGFEEFIWFEGTSKLDGTGGQWILNQNSQTPAPILRISWTKTNSSIGTIRYTYIKNGDLFKDSYIEYGLTAAFLNAYYTVHYYRSAQFWDASIEWNTTTHNGRVKSLEYLSDTDWYCWDANKINSSCP